MLAVIAYQLDLFKKPLSLKVKSNFFISTWLGSFVSLVVFALVSLSFFQSNMISKTNPNVIEKTALSVPAPHQILGKGTLYVVGLLDGNRTTFIDDTIFKIEAWVVQLNGNTPRNFTPVPLIRCQQEFLAGYESFNAHNTFCLVNSQIEINGNQNEGDFTSLEFSLRVCNNATDKNICKPESAILDFFRDKVFMSLYPDYNYNIDDFENPYNLTLRTAFVSDLLSKSLWTGITYKKSTFKSDDDVLLTKVNEKVLPIFDSKVEIAYPLTEGIVFLNTPGLPLSMFYFQSSNNIHEINRRYQKLQEVLANMSGIANTLITVGLILTALESKIQLLSTIIKNLYNFRPKKRNSGNRKEKEKEKQNDQEQNQEYSKIKIKKVNLELKETIFSNPGSPLPKMHSNEITTPININEVSLQVKEQTRDSNIKINPKFFVDEDPVHESQEGDLSEMDTPKKSYAKSEKLQKEYEKIRNFENFYQKVKKSKPVKITAKNLLLAKIKKQFRRKLTDDQKIILRAEEVFEKEIDFVTILQKLQEIEKLKFLLLSQSQISLFNMLSKPVLDIEEDEEKKMNSMVRLL